ncbi:hypothetical protein AVEN_94837-1 [Araneus ventricosus]|uniref:Uncharacterized protein n=1 Tax=Araneus ventricosus TaxID=182803 RepID=A0A4Y2CQI7_ARAVE|nr:hypothetical protein AVEN_94837-1 [Araneus ventricosus]
MAFRNACHTTTNESPNFLVFDRDPVMPYHLIHSEKIRSYSDNPSYAQQLVTQLQSAFNSVKRNLEKQADKYSKIKVSLPKNKKIERLIKVLEREIFPTLESSSDAIDSPAVDAQIDPISDANIDFVEEYPPPLALPYKDVGDDGQNFGNILTQSSCVNQNQILNTTNSQDEGAV